jgi:hypothetical protein
MAMDRSFSYVHYRAPRRVHTTNARLRSSIKAWVPCIIITGSRSQIFGMDQHPRFNHETKHATRSVYASRTEEAPDPNHGINEPPPTVTDESRYYRTVHHVAARACLALLPPAVTRHLAAAFFARLRACAKRYRHCRRLFHQWQRTDPLRFRIK